MAKAERGLRSIFERDEGLLQELGRVVSVWGAINHLIRSAVADLTGGTFEESDKLLFTLNGEGRRLEKLITLLATREDERGIAIRECAAKLKDLSAERNLIVHAGPIWGARTGVKGFYIVDFKEPDLRTRNHEAFSFLKQHLEKLRELGGEMFDLVHAEKIQILDADGNQLAPPSPAYAVKE